MDYKVTGLGYKGENWLSNWRQALLWQEQEIRMQRQGQVSIAPLLCINEIPADWVTGAVDWRGPARVQNSGDLPCIDSLRPHLHIQPPVNFQFYVRITGHGEAEARVLVGDHSHTILSTSRWELLPHNAKKRQHIMWLKLRGNNSSTHWQVIW